MTPFRIGAVIGGILGVGIALTMDMLLGSGLGGSWKEAVASDLNRLFSTSFTPDSLVVYAGVVLVVGFIGAFGAGAGGVFVSLIARVFDALTRERGDEPKE